MKGDQLELELLANEVRRRAGVGEDQLELATRMASRVLGPNAIEMNPALRGAAYLRSTDSGWQIVANPKSRDLRFHVAHELGEWALRVLVNFSGSEAERERAANYIAAASLAPAASVRRAHRNIGDSIVAIAEEFQLSQTATVLRIAEVVGDERAVVTKSGNVLVRSQGVFPWADVPIVQIARGSAWRGLVKTRLSGGIDEGRVALKAR